MPWATYTPKLSRPNSEAQFISIDENRIMFNTGFTKQHLKNHRFVEILTDEQGQKIGFKFNGKLTPTTLTMTHNRGLKFISSKGIISRNPWLKAHLGKKLTPCNEDGIWVIRLTENN